MFLLQVVSSKWHQQEQWGIPLGRLSPVVITVFWWHPSVLSAQWFPSIVRWLPQSWRLCSWTWWCGEERPRKIDIPSVWCGIENGPLGELYPHVYSFLFPKSCISLFFMVMACGTGELWHWGYFPIYVINNILEKPGTLSLDDMLFGGGGSKDTQHLKTDLTDWSFTKDPHVCVCKLHRGPRGSGGSSSMSSTCPLLLYTAGLFHTSVNSCEQTHPEILTVFCTDMQCDKR